MIVFLHIFLLLDSCCFKTLRFKTPANLSTSSFFSSSILAFSTRSASFFFQPFCLYSCEPLCLQLILLLDVCCFKTLCFETLRLNPIRL